jgi:serine protease Do
MAFPRLPDWLIYLVVAAAILAVAAARHEDAQAPEPPPPVPKAGKVPLPESLPFDRARIIAIPDRAPLAGAAFSVSPDGVWLTASQAVADCRRPVLVIAEGRGVEAKIELANEGGVTVLSTPGGAPPIAIASRSKLVSGQRAFIPGYPVGRPGEATGRLIGKTEHGSLPVLAFAESGRTEGLGQALTGLTGAPVLDEQGRAIGVLVADSPRRGTLLSAEPAAVNLAVAKARAKPITTPMAEPVTIDNYYRVADALRRELSVVPVRCLK